MITLDTRYKPERGVRASTFHLKINPEEHHQLRLVAAEYGCDMSTIVRAALQDYFRQLPGPYRKITACVTCGQDISTPNPNPTAA